MDNRQWAIPYIQNVCKTKITLLIAGGITRNPLSIAYCLLPIAYSTPFIQSAFSINAINRFFAIFFILR